MSAAPGMPYAADNWQQQGYTSPEAEIDDMANVGRALMEALPKGYHYNDCPSEIVADLLNRADDLEARLEAVRGVIERGYPDKGLRNDQKCEHGSFGFEDCMGCYDEALLAALDPCDSGSGPKGEKPSGFEGVVPQSGAAKTAHRPKAFKGSKP